MATSTDPNPPTVAGGIGARVSRSDGRAKVTGAADYASDMAVRRPAFAYLHTSAIALGRIVAIDEAAARALPGVIEILTWKNVAGQAPAVPPAKGGSTSIGVLGSPDIQHDGQIVAVVLAEDYETARDASHRLKVTYDERPPSAGFGAKGVTAEALKSEPPMSEVVVFGEAEGAFAAGPVKVDQRYATPTQHHNAMELLTTTAQWSGDELLIFEGSQFMTGLQNQVAQVLKMDPAKVRVISHYVGGAFGGRTQITNRTCVIAVAAKRLGRPVKLVATRDQGFTIATYRAETKHRVRLAATRDGKITALMHDAEELSSRPDSYSVGGSATTARLYGIPNVSCSTTVVHADRNTPSNMRAPAEVPYMFAMESAMDELAHALNMDPVALRRLNDTQVELFTKARFSSRSLNECFETAARAFGWSKRNPKPMSMSDGDWQVGWGCATACYPALIAASFARVTLSGTGAKVEVAGQEIGTGAYTIYAQTAAQMLGLPFEKITVLLGDSQLPPAPVAGGSSNAASICNAVAQTCTQILGRLAAAAVADASGPLHGRDPASLSLAGEHLRSPDGAKEALAKALARIDGGTIELLGGNTPAGLAPDALAKLRTGAPTLGGGHWTKGSIRYSFGAEFVEVHVHRRTREVRVPRMVGAFAAGTIINPVTAHSQLMGGMIWGMSAALHEATEIDPRNARYTNDNLAEYLLPVNADVPSVEVLFVAEKDDQVNPLGIKGVGELGSVGTNAAVCNAVFHATGVRIRELPVRIEKLL